ncbi:hypothetical protein [Streptomyces prunicolor]|uniref:hypothetical protein n=1 Tax=Streptomyces prunicolor TaxID=67348 RepID=UPI0033EE7FFD
MSDNYLTLIPTAPYWQPGRAAAHHAKAAPSALLPDADARRGPTARWLQERYTEGFSTLLVTTP